MLESLNIVVKVNDFSTVIKDIKLSSTVRNKISQQRKSCLEKEKNRNSILQRAKKMVLTENNDISILQHNITNLKPQEQKLGLAEIMIS